MSGALAEAAALLTLEAMLLDEQDWDAWLALYVEDAEFWMPAWKSETEPTGDPQRELSLIYYASRAGLEERVQRIRSGKSVASTPLRRTAHMMGNVLLESEGGGMLSVKSSFSVHVYDTRQKTQHVFFGRTTHGLVPADGVVDLAASFDTVGWFARDVQTMARVGDVMLAAAPDFVPRRLLIAEDAFEFAGAEITDALAAAVMRLKTALPDHRPVEVYTGDPAAWSGIFRILQGDEIRRKHSAWIDAHNPRFGPGIAERFRWTRTIDPSEVERMRPRREEVARHMDALLGDDALLCLPTAPGIAPKLATPAGELEVFRARAFALLSIAGLGRLPQLSLPLGTMAGCPLGISLIAPRGRDRGLLRWVSEKLS